MTIETLLQSLAPVYDSANHDAEDYVTASAYAALKTELWAQFQSIPFGVRFTVHDPYQTADEMFSALDSGSVLQVFTLADLPADHPFTELAPNGESFNSVFRAVHDALAHYPLRNDFSMRGEFRAFQAHARLLSPLAQWAVATETLGQQAWLRYGPTPGEFAEQKAFLLPRVYVDTAITLD